jgi:glycosyltransferase involved in cell wall biosynthesis
MAATVSVALCTHNGSAYIEQQLASILAQTIRPNQLVISDDASSDDTVAIVEAFLAGVPREAAIETTVLRNPEALGVTANFEQAVLATSAEFVVLCDQDDVWHPRRVEAALSRFEASRALVLLSSDAVLVDESGAPLGHSLFEGLGIAGGELAEVHAGGGFTALLRRNLATGATAMFRRELLSTAVPFPEPWVHDEWLAVMAAVSGGFDMLEDRLIDYRQHDSNQIGARRKSLGQKLRRLVEPRGERYRYLVRRSEALASRLDSLRPQVSAETIAEVEGKLAHLRFRAGLPSRRLRRLLPVLREARTGRYGRYSRGLGDVVRDLVQPV